MRTAAPDPNIEPLKVYIDDKGPFFLHTSPEMGMKKLLRLGHERIFQVCKVYRVEENKEIHNTEFTMLEWYREGTYLDAMNEAEDLISYVVDHFPTADRSRFTRPWQSLRSSRTLHQGDRHKSFRVRSGSPVFRHAREGFYGYRSQGYLE